MYEKLKEASCIYEKELPRITIITATFNADKVLPDLILSLRNQNYKNFQWLVIDGASQDSTLELLKEAHDILNFSISEQDKGIYDAWNKALKYIDGEWVLFLGADDILADDNVLFQVALELSKISNEVFWVYGRVKQYSLENRSQIFGEPWHVLETNFSSIMNVPHSALFSRVELFDEVGGFDKSFKIAGDYLFLLEAVQKGFKPKFFPLLVTEMGAGGVSSRPEQAKLTLLEFVRARKKLAIKPLYTPLWIWSYSKAVVKLFLFNLMGRKKVNRIINIYRKLTGRPKF